MWEPSVQNSNSLPIPNEQRQQVEEQTTKTKQFYEVVHVLYDTSFSKNESKILESSFSKMLQAFEKISVANDNFNPKKLQSMEILFRHIQAEGYRIEQSFQTFNDLVNDLLILLNYVNTKSTVLQVESISDFFSW